MARNRYWKIGKSSAKSNVAMAIDYVEQIFAQESEEAVSTDLIEVEAPNMISCPPHFVKLIHALKLLKEIDNHIDNDDLISLRENTEG